MTTERRPSYRDLSPPSHLNDSATGAATESAEHDPQNLLEDGRIPPSRQLPPHESGAGKWVALGLGALAAATAAGIASARRLGRDTPPVYRTLRARPQEMVWEGHRIVYYDRGAEDATPVVFVHGIHAAASARQMQEPFERLMGDHRVLAYDLLGFGASDRPDVEYDAELYERLLRAFLEQVAGGPAHVVADSLSAAHAIELAAEAPELFRSLVVINPTGLLTQAERQSQKGRVLQSLFRAPIVGEALYNLLVSRPSLDYYDRKISGKATGNGTVPATDRPGSRDVRNLRDQEYTTAHQTGARYAPAAFLGDALATNVYMALRTLAVPTLALWTDHNGAANPDQERQAFAGVAPDVEEAYLPDCGARPQEERPDEVEQTLRRWIGRHEGAATS